MSASLSRFQIVEGNPPNLPHQCAICGSINGTFIDFQLDLEFYGTVYFCIENCFTQLANELGYRSPAQHHVALESNSQLRSELVNSLERITELENAVATLRNLDTRHHRPDADALPDVGEGERNNSSTSETKSGSDEQTAKSGSTDILNDDSLNDLLTSDS